MTATLEAPDAAPAPAAVAAPAPVRRRLRRPAVRGLWWITPIGSLAMVIPLSLAVAVDISDSDYRFFYKVPKLLTSSQAELFLLAAVALALGTVVPLALNPGRERRNWPVLPQTELRVLAVGERVAFALTITGYVLLAGIGVARGARPALLINSIVSQSNYTGQLKTIFAPVAGVTSLTQIGIAYVVIAGLLLCHGRSTILIRRLVIVLVLGLLRSYLLTERLALLELVVPLVAIAAARRHQRPRKGGWLQLAPIFALPVLLVVFGAFEYSRSWVFYRTRTSLSFPQFVVNRLAGYYATSYNNGSLQLAHNTNNNRLPFSSIEAFWTAPGISQLHLYQRLTGEGGSDLLNRVLAQYGNPEFNNPGGLAMPILDFGTVGGLVFFFIAGLFVGLAYRSWRSGNPAGLLAYPVLFTGLLELPALPVLDAGTGLSADGLPAGVGLLHEPVQPGSHPRPSGRGPNSDDRNDQVDGHRHPGPARRVARRDRALHDRTHPGPARTGRRYRLRGRHPGRGRHGGRDGGGPRSGQDAARRRGAAAVDCRTSGPDPGVDPGRRRHPGHQTPGPAADRRVTGADRARHAVAGPSGGFRAGQAGVPADGVPGLNRRCRPAARSERGDEGTGPALGTGGGRPHGRRPSRHLELAAHRDPRADPALADQRFALVVGDASPRKNLATLMQVWPAVIRAVPGAKLAVVGPPNWAHTETGERFDALVASGDVLALGHVSDAQLRWAYENAVVALAPSLAEVSVCRRPRPWTSGPR